MLYVTGFLVVRLRHTWMYKCRQRQAVPAHPALTAFAPPCTADAEASYLTSLGMTRKVVKYF